MPEQTIGVVDIGSNTVHLLVAATNGRSITPLEDKSEALHLGGDVDDSGIIESEKVDELVSTITGFQEDTAKAGAATLHLMATHVLRTATNSAAVCEAITMATRLPVWILTPQEEAAYSFRGANISCPSPGPQVMVDIGGGSVEIAVGQDGRVWDSASLPIGASSLVRRFLHTDPPTYLEEAHLTIYLANLMPPALPLADTNISRLVGVGGTMRRSPRLLGLEPGETLSRNAAETMLAGVRGRTSADIAEIYDLRPERARLLLPGLLVIREVLRGYDYPQFVVAEYGLREGAVLNLAQQSKVA